MRLLYVKSQNKELFFHIPTKCYVLSLTGINSRFNPLPILHCLSSVLKLFYVNIRNIFSILHVLQLWLVIGNITVLTYYLLIILQYARFRSA